VTVSERPKTPTTRKGQPPPPRKAPGDFPDDLPTVVDGPLSQQVLQKGAQDHARTLVDKPDAMDHARTIPGKQAGTKDRARPPSKAPPVPQPPVLPPAPSAPSASPAPRRMKAVSMKTPADPNLKPVEKPERDLPHIQLRAMSEVSRAQIPLNLGNLAPPYDPAEARARTVRDYLVWGSLAVIIASGVALVVWFVAT
jgi:hypothetical protein